MQKELENEKKAKRELAERCDQLQLQVCRQVLEYFGLYVLTYVRTSFTATDCTSGDCTISSSVHSFPNDLSMRAAATGSNVCLPLRGFDHAHCVL